MSSTFFYFSSEDLISAFLVCILYFLSRAALPFPGALLTYSDYAFHTPSKTTSAGPVI